MTPASSETGKCRHLPRPQVIQELGPGDSRPGLGDKVPSGHLTQGLQDSSSMGSQGHHLSLQTRVCPRTQLTSSQKLWTV